jgi:NADH-quinone oxidoreductase subunit H
VDTPVLVTTAVTLALWLGLLINIVPVMVWVERRGSAMIQDRPGPNRLGPWGLFQALADAIKFIFKETLVPAQADKPLYLLAPLLSIVPALTTYVVLPLGPAIQWGERTLPMVASGADTGVLLLLAVSSLGVYSLVMAGYSSNNKYSLMGAIRASAQLISYELALTLSVVAVLLPVESLRLDDVVAYQLGAPWLGFLPRWNVFPQIVGFVVFVIAAFAETNRLPFDLPEAESELVAGYHTEYGGMRFALFMMGEYMAMTILSALAATLYLGGWSLPWVDVRELGAGLAPVVEAVAPGDLPAGAAASIGGFVVGLLVLGAKIGAFMFLYVWVRWTFPRFRYDQLMRLGWKVLLPLAIANLIGVAAMALAGWI